jgi:hypothetical protein
MIVLQASAFQNQFYKTYFLNIEQEIFAVLTDSFHKPGFKLHVLVLQHLFCVVCLLCTVTSIILAPSKIGVSLLSRYACIYRCILVRDISVSR